MTEPTIITLAAFARLRGVSKAAVTKWKAQGLLVLVGNKVDVAASIKLLSERAPPARGGRPKAELLAEPSRDASANPSDTWTTAEAVRHERIAVAKLRQIEADKAAGAVAPIAELTDAVRGEYTIVRTVLLGMAAKLAHRLAAATTPEACGALVDAEVRVALGALTADGAP